MSWAERGQFPVSCRRPQLSRSDLRTLLVETGREILREEGLGAGAELLTFKRVTDRIEADKGVRILNGSISGRVWESLFDYQTDVLVTIAADDSTSEIEETLDELTPILLGADPSSEESRWSTVREVCRVGAAANMAALSRSTDWSLWIGVWAVTSVGSAPARRRRIERALEESYRVVTERMERVYQAAMDIVGYRVRPGLTIRQFTDRGGSADRGMRPSEPSGWRSDEWDHASDRTRRRTAGVDAVRAGRRSPGREVLRTRSRLDATARGCQFRAEPIRPLKR